MGALVGVSSTAKKVKRAYIGVNGVARVISTMYSGSTTGTSKLVFEDLSTKITKVRISDNSSTPQVCCVHSLEDSNDIYITGIFKTNVLSQYKVSESGEPVNVGNDISIKKFPVGSLDSSGYTLVAGGFRPGLSGYSHLSLQNMRFSFSWIKLKDNKIEFKRINPATMEDLRSEQSPFFTVALPNMSDSASTVFSAAVQPIGGGFTSSSPILQIIRNDENSAVIFYYNWRGVVYGGYRLPKKAYTNSIANFDYGEAMPAAVQEYFMSSDLGPNTVPSLCYAHMPDLNTVAYKEKTLNIPSGVTDIRVGTAAQPKQQSNIYINTICYTYNGRRYAKLIVDFSLGNEGVLPSSFNVQEYEESVTLPSGASTSSAYNWQVLGHDANYIYVLSTMSDTIKILAFSYDTDDKSFRKEYEFNTYVKMAANSIVNLEKIIPMPFVGRFSEKTAERTHPAFVLQTTISINTHADVFIVPRYLIIADENKVQ